MRENPDQNNSEYGHFSRSVEAHRLLEEIRYASLYDLSKCMTPRRSISKVFHRIADMNNFVNFTGKHLRWVLLYDRAADLGL